MGGSYDTASTGVIDNDVGVAARGKQPLSWIETEEPGGIFTEYPAELPDANTACGYAGGIHHGGPVLYAGHTVGDEGEVMEAHLLLPLEVKGAVVGGDEVNLSA